MDTIAAIATATGVGGVGIVRVSGPRAIEIVAGLIGVSDLGREVRVARIPDLDEVIAFAMRAPRSFTGEDVAEIQGHGGARNLAKLLEAVLARGARIAEPGEFTRRAVANGKLDLLRAEALLGVIHAGSERAWRLAQAALAGRFGDEVRALEQRGLDVLAEIEGRIDFPEDDLEPASVSAISSALAAVADGSAALAAGFRRGRAINEGISVALVGAVNVGKSSLLNALVGAERALVDDQPGTTRDYVEARVEWDGIAVTLIDTAGLRDTGDDVERRGIALGEARVAAADVVVVVDDGSGADASRFGDRAVVVHSKADLRPALAGLATSARTGQGLEALRRQILALAGVADQEGAEPPFVTTARQHEVAARAALAFAAARDAFAAHQVPEIVALELRTGAQALAELRGVEVGDRVLDQVFARFCIGK